jgi:gamma-glutamylcyclotransferase (GGCT)/AIG2-like uncharacterized protein YtfP
MKLFVYGTLMKGFYNSYLLEGLECVPADVRGGIVSMGTFPAFRRDLPGTVQGELYEVDEAKLQELDQLEIPYGYRRVEVRARTGIDGQMDCDIAFPAITYEIALQMPPERMIKGGDWRAYEASVGLRRS